MSQEITPFESIRRTNLAGNEYWSVCDMKYEGRMMKWIRSSGFISSFIIHPSTFLPLLRLTADSPDLLAIIKAEGKV